MLTRQDKPNREVNLPTDVITDPKMKVGDVKRKVYEDHQVSINIQQQCYFVGEQILLGIQLTIKIPEDKRQQYGLFITNEEDTYCDSFWVEDTDQATLSDLISDTTVNLFSVI